MNSLDILLRPSLDKRGYRLRCRFKIEPYPTKARLDRERVTVAEQFVSDMHKQGWEHDARHAFKMTGPFPMVPLTTIHPRSVPTAKEMVPYVKNGARFLDQGKSTATTIPPLDLSEWWEYEIAGVFVRTQIMTEYADRHEEQM